MRLDVRRSGRGRKLAGGAPTSALTSAGYALLLTATLATAARAQWGVWQADSLLASGRVAAAESLYYAASSANPHNASARAALGRYLAARGALRIGAVLLEEARLFGGDSAAIARALAPIYRSLGDYRSLAVLPKAPLSAAERRRVSWLVSHQQELQFEDTIATLPYEAVADGSGLGLISVTVGERRVDALVDPTATGVVLRGRAARRRDEARVFGSDSTGLLAVIPELHIGDVVLTNVPARIDTAAATGARRQRAETPSLIGLDVLRRLAPTFDPTTSTLTLRRSGTIGPSTPGTRSPILLDENGLRMLVSGHWDAATSRSVATVLANRRWTLDAKRGEAILQ